MTLAYTITSILWMIAGIIYAFIGDITLFCLSFIVGCLFKIISQLEDMKCDQEKK